MKQNHVWIVGVGGLLGSAVEREFAKDDEFAVMVGEKIDWTDQANIEASFSNNFQQLIKQAQSDPWIIVWAAGQASTTSTKQDTELELEIFCTLIRVIKKSAQGSQGTVFLTSSAGGVYAGSSSPPFSIDTEPHPLSYYGELKLAQEKFAQQELSGVCKVVIGRVSNLYGPGQDVSKLQGLISQLVVSSLTKQPLKIFVSLDTMRDYIYVDDAATIIKELSRNAKEPLSKHIIASGQSVSLGYLIQLTQDIARTRIPIAVGAHDSAAAQARDLRLIPTDVNQARRITTTLPAGIKNVYLDILHRRQEA